MAIIGNRIDIHIRYTYLGQKCQNVMSYEPGGAAFLTADMIQVLEAYWNNIKGAFRALASTSAAVNTFDSLLGIEHGLGNQMAEYPIPPAERVGTRAAGDDGEWLSSFTAVGCRLTVATRSTRPGQKRLPFLRESDVTGNTLVPSIITLMDPAFQKFGDDVLLGAPVATGVLLPLVVHEPTVAAPAYAQQLVTGYTINPDVTTQVSRKKGRGA